MEGNVEKHEHTAAVLNRLSRAIGHLRAVRTMVENNRDCSEILIQLSAVKSEISNTNKVILKDHLEHCLVQAITENNEQVLERLKSAVDTLL